MNARGRLAEEIGRTIGSDRGAQQRAALVTGVSRSSVSRWIAGTTVPAYQSLDRLCDTLNEADGRHLRDLYSLAVLERERAGERRGMLIDSVTRIGSNTGPVQLLRTQDEIYTAAAMALEDAVENDVQPRFVDWASLHGMSGPRRDDRATAEQSKAINRFERAFDQLFAFEDRGNEWTIRHVFNVASIDDLNRMMSRIGSRDECTANYEVWTYVSSGGPPSLSPLIICNRWTFMAAEDHRVHRVSSGVSVEDRTAAIWARAWFDEMVLGAPIRVRTAGGVDDQAVDRLASQLKST
jgi:hypothetical protein